MLSWLKGRRRRLLLGQPFPEKWQTWLAANFALYPLLPIPQRVKLHDLIQVFVPEKNWEGCDGLEMTDEIRVTIAAQACLLALGVEPNFYFDEVRTILVFPKPLLETRREEGPLIVEDEEGELYGELIERDVVRLSWPDVLETGRDLSDGENLVVHEFAHFLDAAYGGASGFPTARRSEHEIWRQVLRKEHQRLVKQAGRGRRTLLDQYGVIDEGEFFAVATECFFEHPRPMQERHEELYAVLQAFYRQDPADWNNAESSARRPAKK